jgi:uncharacterized coiled-coil protein SlyX
MVKDKSKMKTEKKVKKIQVGTPLVKEVVKPREVIKPVIEEPKQREEDRVLIESLNVQVAALNEIIDKLNTEMKSCMIDQGEATENLRVLRSSTDKVNSQLGELRAKIARVASDIA